ncbi:methionine ABC transporter ATP-binding protein [Erysipelothrix urinaevulpis]|uniref:methionine ABC transporter ATP-binding protein n=1 Tax=Erysipelothrix urinaevulpis TaxID=2683717 RepID=UPI001358CEFB|nr:methionine ABC transporter ATP-binding protein [Erysipelothrix urinaevulpis]
MITINNVSKTFITKDRSIHALVDVSLNIKKGDIYGIIGQSGAGKSTLIRTINFLEEPDSGDIVIQNDDLKNLSLPALRNKRKRIGMIFQNFNLFSTRTVYENIEYPLNRREKKGAEEKINNLLKLVGLENRQHAYPDQLSGGQKQRVAIARALVNDPDILLCDEATSALDPKTTESVLELLAKINRELGVTIVLITHEMSVVKAICNKVALMKDGRILNNGSLEDVFSSSSDLLDSNNFDLESLKLNREGYLLQLSFKHEEAQVPLISKLSRLYSVEANILHGNIETIGKSQFGRLIINLYGSEVEEALDYLKKNVDVEVLSYE